MLLQVPKETRQSYENRRAMREKKKINRQRQLVIEPNNRKSFCVGGLDLSVAAVVVVVYLVPPKANAVTMMLEKRGIVGCFHHQNEALAMW